MRVLVSNDDGIHALGLLTLVDQLRQSGHDVIVVAPDRDCSGASHALTLDRPIRVTEIDSHTYCVAGTPVDCIHLALTGLLPERPDLVVSGINNTANMGDDVIYSGTVSAAMEGRFLGISAVAVSLVTNHSRHEPLHYRTAAAMTVDIVARLRADPLPPTLMLNVNVPNLASSALRGIQTTRLGHRHAPAPSRTHQDPRGQVAYWIGTAGPEDDAGPGTDFAAVRANQVSITPIHVDLTHHQALDLVGDWTSQLSVALDASV